jgi:hypothetical protein
MAQTAKAAGDPEYTDTARCERFGERPPGVPPYEGHEMPRIRSRR